MIACRSLFRTERTWQLANTIVSSTRLECYSHHGLMTYRKQSFAEDYSSSMGWKKKIKSANTGWRPVCTVSSSNAECSADVPITESTDLVNEDASSVREAAESNFSSTNLQDKAKISKVEGALFEAACSSSTLPDNAELKAAQDASDLSAAKHSIPIEVGASLMRFIKGKGGAMQKSIEEEMGVTIIFPSSKKEDSIIIEGGSVKSITKASDKIQTIISEAVQSPNLDYSHFISLPLAVHPELVEKLFRFQNVILGEDIEENADDGSDENASEDETKRQLSETAPAVEVKLDLENASNHVKVDIKNIPPISYQPKSSKRKSLSDLGIDKSIFIKPKTFHLTVLMLKLWNKERVHAAKEVLQSISTKVMDALDGRPLSIKLKGLDCMRGSLAKARVLYAPVEEIGNEDRLVRACQVIIDAYIEAGLVLEKDVGQKLKLHATLMNARHRKSKTRNKKFDSFDARGIFDKYGSEEWGEYHIREAHLSQRFVFDSSGYYHCCASIPFPSSMPVEQSLMATCGRTLRFKFIMLCRSGHTSKISTSPSLLPFIQSEIACLREEVCKGLNSNLDGILCFVMILDEQAKCELLFVATLASYLDTLAIFGVAFCCGMQFHQYRWQHPMKL